MLADGLAPRVQGGLLERGGGGDPMLQPAAYQEAPFIEAIYPKVKRLEPGDMQAPGGIADRLTTGLRLSVG